MSEIITVHHTLRFLSRHNVQGSDKATKYYIYKVGIIGTFTLMTDSKAAATTSRWNLLEITSVEEDGLHSTIGSEVLSIDKT